MPQPSKDSSWTRVTKSNPCGICNHGDWCSIGEFGWCCMRIQNDRPVRNGGWFHPFDTARPVLPLPKPLHSPAINATALIRQWTATTEAKEVAGLAGGLGVSVSSLGELACCWAAPHRAWAFPMRDGYGEILGIRLRSESGQKWAVTGSRQGIFLPISRLESTVWICEGPTDTAAALTLGLSALGRPSCPKCGELCLFPERMEFASGRVRNSWRCDSCSGRFETSAVFSSNTDKR